MKVAYDKGYTMRILIIRHADPDYSIDSLTDKEPAFAARFREVRNESREGMDRQD